jgi:hypothetical protein
MNIQEVTKKAKYKKPKKSIGVKTTPERYCRFRFYCRIHKTNPNRLINTFINECIDELKNSKGK